MAQELRVHHCSLRGPELVSQHLHQTGHSCLELQLYCLSTLFWIMEGTTLTRTKLHRDTSKELIFKPSCMLSTFSAQWLENIMDIIS